MLDVLVVGGGITGLGVARLAARAGWSVVVVERDDLASGASGASSHMLHGGLRYLEHGHFALVREALAERRAVLRMAPALAAPVRFMVPLRRGGGLPAWKLRAGLALYDLLAGRDVLARHAMVSAREALAAEPALAAEGLAAAGLYTDAVMDDARLAVAVARDAAAHGAAIRAHTAIVRVAMRGDGAVEVTTRDGEDGHEERLAARAIVNATGAWSDGTRRELGHGLWPHAPQPPRRLRPSRGVHLLYPALTRGHGVLARAGTDGRVFFVVPFAGHSLVGTTEIETDSPPTPEQSPPTADEVRYLAREVARVLPAATAQRPLAAFAGVRPLLDAGAAVGGASRQHRVIAEGPLVTIAGGKYTTFRVMAHDALAAVAHVLGRDPDALRDSCEPLPAPLDPGATPDAVGEHAARHEFARTLADALRRGGASAANPRPAAEVAHGMARVLGWDEARTRREVAQTQARRDEASAWLARATGTH